MAKCEWCGEEKKYVATHHLIPRWVGGDGGEMIEVCRKCHYMLEQKVDAFVKYGSFNRPYWRNEDKHRRYVRNYHHVNMRRKDLFCITPVKGVHLIDYLWVNLKTGTVTVTNQWHGVKKRGV